MGFSEKEIAAQKAREQSVRLGAKGAKESTSQAAPRPAESAPAGETGAADQQPNVSTSKADGVSVQKPSSASPAVDPDSH
jgi:hypothetical protein